MPHICQLIDFFSVHDTLYHSICMPKKTKREKIIAQYRRKLGTIPQSMPVEVQQEKEKDKQVHTVSYSIPVHTKVPDTHVPTMTASEVESFAEVKKDLIKTLLLVAIMLGAELVVWKLVG